MNRSLIIESIGGAGEGPARVEAEEPLLVGARLMHMDLGEPGGGEPRDGVERPGGIRTDDHAPGYFVFGHAVGERGEVEGQSADTIEWT